MEPADQTSPARWTHLPSWLLTQTARHAHRLVAEGFGSVGARGYDYRVLATLADGGPASQADLGRCSGIHLSDLVAVVNELADRGFVDRAPDPNDRRRNIVTITESGRRQLDRLHDRLTETQDAIFAPLSTTDRQQLARLLARVLDHHDRNAPTDPHAT